MANLKNDKPDITKLYKELIIKHASNPCNFGSLNSDAVRSTGINPLCGDKLEIYISTHKDTIEKIRFEGVGCAISVASASMLTEILKDKSITEAKKIASSFIRELSSNTELSENDFIKNNNELSILCVVKDFPTRIKCVNLSWQTFLSAFDDNIKITSTE
jgi:nitrogen fixation NifU-like protein